MNAPRELELAGVVPRAFPGKRYLDHRMVIFLSQTKGRKSERAVYEELLLDSQIWKEMQGFSLETGYTHAIEIMGPEGDLLRAIGWTMQPNFHVPYARGTRLPGPHRLLLFRGPTGLMDWKEKYVPSTKRFSVHRNLETPDGIFIKDAFLLILYNDG